jgi:hypothetical protein
MSKGGRTAHGERLYRKLFVPPERARELLRVFIAVVNEVYTVDSAVARLTPFFCATEADAALLADELRKLRTLTQVREERRIEHNTDRILRELETGLLGHAVATEDGIPAGKCGHRPPAPHDSAAPRSDPSPRPSSLPGTSTGTPRAASAAQAGGQPGTTSRSRAVKGHRREEP